MLFNFRTILSLLLWSAVIVSCGSNKKKMLSKEEVSNVKEFIESFDVLKLPFNFDDSSLLDDRLNDSMLISKQNYSRFIPDSVFNKDFSKEKNIKLYAVGRVQVPNNETYLFVKAIKGNKRVGYVLCFDEKDSFRVSLPLVRDDNKKNTSFSATMDKKYTITVSRERKEGEELFYSYSTYYYTTAGDFMLAAINSNEQVQEEELVNPIDTLPRKMKFCGDYYMDKYNLVSVRDGRNDKERIVFITLKRNNGDCDGEVKGTLTRTGENTFRFSGPGDPCKIDLVFEGRNVSIKEATGCGNHREMDCLFSGSYTLRKEAKPALKPTAKSSKKK
jgi:hypothetical protein